MMVGDLPGGNYFPSEDQGVVSIDTLRELVKSYTVEQAIVLNDKLGYVIRHGKLLASEEAGADSAAEVSIRAGVKAKWVECELRLTQLTVLLTATKGIMHLMSSSSARGHLHFPALRMKLPMASMLVLASAADGIAHTGHEGMAVLDAFAEYYRYVKQWEVE